MPNLLAVSSPLLAIAQNALLLLDAELLVAVHFHGYTTSYTCTLHSYSFALPRYVHTLPHHSP